MKKNPPSPKHMPQRPKRFESSPRDFARKNASARPRKKEDSDDWDDEPSDYKSASSTRRPPTRAGHVSAFNNRRNSSADEMETQDFSNPKNEFKPLTFADIFCSCTNAEFDRYSPEALATMDYKDELDIKQRAIAEFWRKKHLPGKPAKIVPAPLPRHYRSVSKRRAILLRTGKLILAMGYARGGVKMKSAPASLLEPVSHNRLYTALEKLLNLPQYQPLARALNYLIVRGSEEQCILIVNIAVANGTVIRKIKMIAEHLKELEPVLAGCFMYLDETRSDFYLEATRPFKKTAFKKIFGSEMLELNIRNRRLLYPPTVFSQVNEPMIPLFVDTAFNLLKPEKNARFLDLYCGYGLFGLLAADDVAGMIGMDLEGPAIEAAANSARYHFAGRSFKFIASSITSNSIETKLPPAGTMPELILLDPPRNGTASGVIEKIIARKPLRVLHIFCGTDAMPKELKIWVANGFFPKKIVPVDLFPGSINLETLVLLERAPQAYTNSEQPPQRNCKDRRPMQNDAYTHKKGDMPPPKAKRPQRPMKRNNKG